MAATRIVSQVLDRPDLLTWFKAGGGQVDLRRRPQDVAVHEGGRVRRAQQHACPPRACCLRSAIGVVVSLTLGAVGQAPRGPSLGLLRSV